MNLKAYLRGIGAGMVITAVIMGAFSQQKPMTDDEVISRARELGYTETTTLSELKKSEADGADKKDVKASTEVSAVETTSVSKDVTSVSKEAVTETKTSVSKSSVSKSETSVGIKEDKKTDDKSEASVSASVSTSTSKTSVSSSVSASTKKDDKVTADPIDPLPKDDEGYVASEKSVTIKVIGGDSSVSVARRMYEAGLVESAVEFDEFLCANGYDKSISVGTYEIDFGLSFDTMARIITRQIQ